MRKLGVTLPKSRKVTAKPRLINKILKLCKVKTHYCPQVMWSSRLRPIVVIQDKSQTLLPLLKKRRPKKLKAGQSQLRTRN